MTVYVDDMLREAAVRNGDHTVRGRWSHLMADTSAELLVFGDHLGLSRTWLQKPGSPMEHFDITAGKRLRAIEFGTAQIALIRAFVVVAWGPCGSSDRKSPGIGCRW